MQALKAALRGYLRGEQDLVAVRSALEEALETLPGERRGDLVKLLQAARAAGLAEAHFTVLASRVEAATAAEVEAGAESGSGAGHLSTVVLPSTPRRREPAAPDPPAAEPAGDGQAWLETVVLPGSPADVAARRRSRDETRDRQQAAGDDTDPSALDDSGVRGSDDTTIPVRNDDPEATVVNADDPADATVFERGDDADATELPAGEEADVTVFPAERHDERTDPGAATAPRPADGDPRRDPTGPQSSANEARADGAADTTEVGPAVPVDPSDATRVNPAAGADDATAMDARVSREDATTLGRPPAGEPPAAQAAERGEAEVTAPRSADDEDADATALHVAGDDSDRTEMVADRGDGFDIFAPENLAAAEGARGRSGASWPTGAPPPPPPSAGRDYGSGERIRDRFELISKLGEGGMGTVWKAKDLLKEEARDRNPFVAMKLLQGDFKSHPEAFIALQRETAKQQRLAHPNIATVYDFDRDATTGTVFMTMEVMEGQPLDAFIRKLPADGLPFAEAMPLIEQLCRGLQYAHDNALVHSDLKPGNCFLTRENTVKLLDFGIARASKTKSDAEGETTLFDPGQLGALTPTYATIEMFEGRDPDPRDDIYALAIIAYQLLTGRHPYGKKSAPKARDLKLQPAPVAGLDKRQNRALRRALAFSRDERTPTVAEFLEGLTPHRGRTGLLVGGGIAAALIIAALAYGPLVGELERREREQIIEVIEAGDLQSLQVGLAQVRALAEPEQRARVLDDPRVIDVVVGLIAGGGEQDIARGRALLEGMPSSWQRTVMDDERVRAAIIELYEARRVAAANPAEGRYDFPAANRAIEELKRLYPDSATVYRIETELKSEQDTLLNELGGRYNELLAAGRLVSDPEEEDIGDVLSLVRTIDPDNGLLADDGLRFEFEERVEQAMAADDYATAKRYLDESLAYAPDNPTLANLRYQVDTELRRLADQQLVAEIQQRLRAEYPTLRTLEDFQRVRDDLTRLADLEPANPVLGEIRNGLHDAFDTEMDRLIAARQWQQGEELLVDFAKLLEIAYVTTVREQLSSAERQAGYELAMTAERGARVEERVERLRELLAKPALTGDWEFDFKVPFKELIALLPHGHPALASVREAVSRLYLSRAAEARETGRFAEALAYVDGGRVFHPGLAGFDAEQRAVVDAREALRRQREAQERLARLERRKGELLVAAKADDTDKARQILAELAAALPADDAFVAIEAPRAIADSYLNLARLQADGRQFENALRLAGLGLELVPDHAALREESGLWEQEVARRAEQLAVGRLFASAEPLDTSELAPRVEQVRAQFPEDWSSIARGYAQSRAEALESARVRSPQEALDLTRRAAELERLLPDAFTLVEQDLANLVGRRLGALEVGDDGGLRALAAPLEEVRRLFPDAMTAVGRSLGEGVARQIKALERSDLRQAHQMLASARQVLPDSTPLRELSLRPLPVDCKLAPAGLAQVEAGALSAAYTTLNRMQQQEPNCTDTVGFEAAAAARLAKAREAYQLFAALVQARRRSESCVALGQAMVLWNDSPDFETAKQRYCPQDGAGGDVCNESLAGHGAKKRAACADKLSGGGTAPTLVVIPAGGARPRPFAIGKYEVSVADYNGYCRASGECQPRATSDTSLPVTGISLADAQSYAQWLSRSTGKTYRLPTAGEWEHAANAGGSPPGQSELNCRVESGGQVIKGFALVNAQSGQPNGWGLINVVGNAQEWVTRGGGVEARGGAFEDPLVRCGVSLSKPHDGGGDDVTGFRLVRELG